MNLFTLMAKIGMDDKEFQKGVDNSRTKFQGFGKTVTKVVAGLGIAKLGKDMVSLGIKTNASLEQSGVAWTTLLGSQTKSKEMLDKITEYAKDTPFSKMGVDAMAKQLTNAGFKGDALFAQLTKFGDMGSAFGVQEDSLKEMVRQYAQVQMAQVAYTEDLNILQDRGIPIYKALGEVMNVPVSQVKKMASEGKVTAEVYNKAIDSIAGKTTGAMEAQSKTFNGLWSTIKDGAENIIGKIMIPIFNVAKSVLEAVAPVIDNIAPKVDAFADKFQKFVDIIVDNKETVLAFLASMATGFAIFGTYTKVTAMATAFKTLMSATQGATLAQKLFNIALNANPIGIIITLISTLVAGFVYLWNTSEGFRTFWINMWEGIKASVTIVVAGIVTFFTETIPNAISNFISWVSSFPEKVGEIFDIALETIKGWGTNIWNFFTETIPNAVNFVIEWFQNIPYMIGYALGNALGNIVKWGIDTWNYFTTNIPIWIDAIGKWFSELPGRVGEWLSRTIDKVVTWGRNLKDRAITAVSNTINSIIDWFSRLPSRVWDWLVRTVTKIVNWGKNLYTAGKEAGKKLVDSIITAVKNIPNKMVEIGQNIVKGVWNGIVGMAGWIGDKITGFFSGLVDGAKNALGIHSPSRVFRDEVGRYMAEGVGVGFENEMDDINSQIQSSIEIPKVNTVEAQRQNTNNSLIDAIKELAKREIKIEIDGREIMQVLAPYQDEFKEYNQTRTIAYNY